MFYSHQLLARKAPLGQIWRAATMHAKINRRNLSKLNIIHICEQILNPSVPMALRLSGILMGGVVIVYERKVKLLYDDVTRLLIEINEAWKLKPAPDPTVLPKGKSQAKKEAVTLPENTEADVPDIEQSLDVSNAPTMAFQRTAYCEMRLDSVEDFYINNDPMAEDASLNHHQGDADNINLFERFHSYQANRNAYNHFERFDIEEDEETQLNFNSGEHMEIPTTLIPSPATQDQTQRADEVQGQHPENQANHQSSECKKDIMDEKGQRPTKRKTRRQAASAMDYEQTIVPGHIYQSWLQNASDIFSRRTKRKAQRDIISTRKVANLMELPPTVLTDDLFTKGNGEFYYPAPLMELWMKSTQPPQDFTSERTSPPLLPELSSSSPPEGVHDQDPVGYTFGDFQSGVGSESRGVSIEKLRANVINNEIPAENLIGELRANLMSSGVRKTADNFMTPGNSDGVRSIPSSGSGYDVPNHLEVSSGRTNKKKPSSKQSGSSLEPVDEENSWQYPDPNFKLSRLSENGLMPDAELLVETGPTQTQRPIISPSVDKITDSIRMQMKSHFESPGAPQVESLDKLTTGMNRKQAALLFYQTCVLASCDLLSVAQKVPYGDILISKGTKM